MLRHDDEFFKGNMKSALKIHEELLPLNQVMFIETITCSG
jgi:dihydrodipicolinate synthase/N-acetylneuraminate lyase